MARLAHTLYVSLHVHLFKSKFHPAGMVLHQFCFPVSIFCDKSFWQKINDFVTFGTQIFELWVDSEIKIYRDTFKKDISFWIYVKIRYENFHCSVIVDNIKGDCVLLEKLRKLQRVVHVLLPWPNTIQLLIIDWNLSKPGATQFSIGSFELVR